MIGDYLVDVFRAADADGRQRTSDGVVHGLGLLAILLGIPSTVGLPSIVRDLAPA